MSRGGHCDMLGGRGNTEDGPGTLTETQKQQREELHKAYQLEAIKDAIFCAIIPEYCEALFESFLLLHILSCFIVSIEPVSVFQSPASCCQGYCQMCRGFIDPVAPFHPVFDIIGCRRCVLLCLCPFLYLLLRLGG